MSKRRLNGWQRVWVVGAVLWMAWACLWGVGKFPTEAEQDKWWAQVMRRHVSNKTSTADRKDSERRIEKAREGRTDKEFIDALPGYFPEVDFRETLASYKRSVEGVRADRHLWVAILLG